MRHGANLSLISIAIDVVHNFIHPSQVFLTFIGWIVGVYLRGLHTKFIILNNVKGHFTFKLHNLVN